MARSRLFLEGPASIGKLNFETSMNLGKGTSSIRFIIAWCEYGINPGEGNMAAVIQFDRLAKKLQRDRTAKNEDYLQFNYIKDEVFKV